MPPWRLLEEDEEAVRADNTEPNEPQFGRQQKVSRALHKNSARRFICHVSQSLNVH